MKISSKMYSIDKFKQLIKYECDRAKRSNHGFSLVIFESDEKGSLSDVMDPLMGRFVNYLLNTVRLIDMVGFIKTNIAGVLLPTTEYDSAGVFVANLKESGSEFDTILKKSTVYSYPDRWSGEIDKLSGVG